MNQREFRLLQLTSRSAKNAQYEHEATVSTNHRFPISVTLNRAIPTSGSPARTPEPVLDVSDTISQLPCQSSHGPVFSLMKLEIASAGLSDPPAVESIMTSVSWTLGTIPAPVLKHTRSPIVRSEEGDDVAGGSERPPQAPTSSTAKPISALVG